MLATDIQQVCGQNIKRKYGDFPLQSNRQERIIGLFLTIDKLFHHLPLEYNQLETMQATLKALF